MLTTTIAAYPKPDDVPIMDWFGKDGGTDTAEPTAGYAETLAAHPDIEQILDRATREVVAEQEGLGIDIPTDGEIRRENFIHYHCRHLVGIDFQALSEKEMRRRYQALLPTITGPIQAGPAFLVRDWRVAQSATRRPVKITVPGPLTIGDSVADEHYRDPRLRGAALLFVDYYSIDYYFIDLLFNDILN
jgi:5-methyltetrahydropteroyltriglutamate--homocysteine methyltransferase